MRLLVTGFPPYDHFKTNSTQILVESMINDLPKGLTNHSSRLIFEIVNFDNTNRDTQRQTMIQNLENLLTEHRPHACLFCGQAPTRSAISVEGIAINIFNGKRIELDGPAAYWATLPEQEKAARLLTGEGIPSKLSFHAGTHLCNHILYSGLHYAHTKSIRMNCGMMHVPLTEDQIIEMGSDKPFMSLEMSRRALTILLLHHVGCLKQRDC